MAYDPITGNPLPQSPILLKVEGLEEVTRLLHELLAMNYRQVYILSEATYQLSQLAHTDTGRYGKEWYRQQHGWLIKAEEHEDAARPKEG